MEVDCGPPAKPDPDDLSKYNLDDYDNEVESSGTSRLQRLLCLTYTVTSVGAIQQYQRPYIS